MGVKKDRYIMPLASEVKEHAFARKIECPVCGKKCWMTDIVTTIASVQGSRVIIHCSDCELKEGNKNANTRNH